MIIVDLQHVLIASIMQAISQERGMEVSPTFIRHIALNCLRSYKHKFKHKYGTEIVLACEGRDPWRREVFPHYKAKRRESREVDGLDWDKFFETIKELKAELRAHFPYKVIEVDHAEADDIIGVLASEALTPCLIVSGDKDFLQLQRNPNVAQYRPVQKDFPVSSNPLLDLEDMILSGDTSDGIPNFLSDGDTFVVEGKRQKSLTAKKKNKWLSEGTHDDWTQEMWDNYKRNATLIFLDNTPDHLKSEIRDKYQVPPKGNTRTVYEYLVQNRLRNLIEVAEEF